MKNMKRIHSVTIKRMYDDSPDLSWLGEYGTRAESEFSIDRKHAEDCPQQAFNAPTESIEMLERAIDHVMHADATSDFYDGDACDLIREIQDEIAEECTCGGQFVERNSCQYFNPCHENYKGCERAEIIKYCLQDFARAESGNNGDWCMIGIRAECEYYASTPEGKGHVNFGPIQKLTSGGLWGVESDSGDDHLESIEQEELAELKHELLAIGFSKRAISTAFKSIEESGDAR